MEADVCKYLGGGGCKHPGGGEGMKWRQVFALFCVSPPILHVYI